MPTEPTPAPSGAPPGLASGVRPPEGGRDRDVPAGTIPHGATARRLTWPFLPAPLRAHVEERLGAPVVDAVSRTSGFTPGFASVLTTARGRRIFLKAANRRAQATAAASYAEEARKRRLLGDRIPAPALLWSETDSDRDWVVLAFEAYDGRAPDRPWTQSDLERCLDLAETIAAAMAVVPPALGLRALAEDLPEMQCSWSLLGEAGLGHPHLAELDSLARSFGTLPARAFCHADFRDDNILLSLSGADAVACDWNWPALGPAWLDTADLLLSAYGDGLDVEPMLRSRALIADADPEHLDAWLAAVQGYMTLAASRPTPSSSPYLGAHAQWYARAAGTWLAQRRGW